MYSFVKNIKKVDMSDPLERKSVVSLKAEDAEEEEEDNDCDCDCHRCPCDDEEVDG